MNKFFKNFFSKTQQSFEEQNLSNRTTISFGLSIFEKKDFSDTSQFQEYLHNIPQQLKKIKKRKIIQSVTFNTIKTDLLEKCYRKIPKIYFKQKDFELEFKMFIRKDGICEEYQNKCYEYLDSVQLCLFNQVTSKFDQFISMMMAIDSLELILQLNLKKITEIRQINKQRKQKLCDKTEKIIRLKRVYDNKKAIYDLLKNINQVHKISEIIKNNINKNRQYCLSIIQQLKTDRNKLIVLKCLQNFDRNIELSQSIIKKNFTQSFSDQTFHYIKQGAHYNTQFWEKLSLRNDLIVQNISELDNTTILYQQDMWIDQKIILIQKEKQEKILQIILNGWKNNQLAVDITKDKLSKHITNIFNEYVKDIKIFCQNKLKQHGEIISNHSLEQILQKMSLEFYGKVLEFYSEIHKKFLKRSFSLFKLVLDRLIDLTTKIEQVRIPQLSNLIQGIFNIQFFLIKTILEKVIKLLNYKKINSDIEVAQFKNYIGLFEHWEKFFQHQVAPFIQYIIPVDCPIKDRLYILKSKINISYVTHNKNQLITSYFSSFHKFIIEQQLKMSLQNDTWTEIDIPTESYGPIGYLISGQSWISNRKNVQTTMMMQNSLFVDRDHSSFLHRRRQGSSIIKPDELIQKSKISIKIIKNECIIGNKIYKIIDSFLLLIQILQEYVKIYECFPIIKQQISIKLTQLCNYYNTATLQLIIGGGACLYQKIKSKRITARHLALSSVCLEFLTLIITRLSQRIKIYNQVQLLENINVHNEEIIKKLNSILITKIQQSIDLIELKLTPSQGTKAITQNSRKLLEILSDYFEIQKLRRVFDQEMFNIFMQKMKKFVTKDKISAKIFQEQINYFFSQLQILKPIVESYKIKKEQAQSLIIARFQCL